MFIQQWLEMRLVAFRKRYPWFRSGNFKVASYRGQLDQIAERLSEMRKRRVRTRFNRAWRSAELHSGNKVIARISVVGGIYFDGDMSISGELTADERKLFRIIPLTCRFSS